MMFGRIITKSNFHQFLRKIERSEGMADHVITFTECHNIAPIPNLKPSRIGKLTSSLIIFDLCDEKFVNMMATPDIFSNPHTIILNESEFSHGVPFKFFDLDTKFFISNPEFNEFYERLDDRWKIKIEKKIMPFFANYRSCKLEYYMNTVVS